MTGNSSNTNGEIPPGRQLIKEGTISMLYPTDVVFYNPVQVQNRDLSLFMITLFCERRVQRAAIRAHKKKLNKEYKAKGEKIHNHPEIKTRMETFEQEYKLTNEYVTNIKGVRILDALAASGLRSLRYHKEIPSSFVHSITINDLDPAAVDLAKENMSYNNLSHALVECDEEQTKGGICVQIGDATQVLYNSRRQPNIREPTVVQQSQKDQYDVIDLDPYGSAAPFIDGAVQAISNGGMLLVTCTDMAALGGSHPETCYGRYGSMPIPRVGYLQELAVRTLLGNLAQRAAVYGRTIRPILSVGMNFYVRVFVEVWDDKAGVSTLQLEEI
jgi:tRNA (guanine26-N2/guanine27-N2)-dimethyltransferase